MVIELPIGDDIIGSFGNGGTTAVGRVGRWEASGDVWGDWASGDGLFEVVVGRKAREV